jgi:hypothetical protein
MASANDVMTGKVKNPESAALKQALAEAVSGSATGTSSGGKSSSDK